MRYVLLDRISLLEPPNATGIKCVSLSDDVFGEHFPGYPIFPGAMVLESMAQLGGVLLEAARRETAGDDRAHAVLSMADRVRFRRQVRPGDRMSIAARILAVSEDGGQVEVEVEVEGQRTAGATLGFAFASVTDTRLLQTRRDVLATWLRGTIA